MLSFLILIKKLISIFDVRNKVLTIYAEWGSFSSNYQGKEKGKFYYYSINKHGHDTASIPNTIRTSIITPKKVFEFKKVYH